MVSISPEASAHECTFIVEESSTPGLEEVDNKMIKSAMTPTDMHLHSVYTGVGVALYVPGRGFDQHSAAVAVHGMPGVGGGAASTLSRQLRAFGLHGNGVGIE